MGEDPTLLAEKLTKLMESNSPVRAKYANAAAAGWTRSGTDDIVDAVYRHLPEALTGRAPAPVPHVRTTMEMVLMGGAEGKDFALSWTKGEMRRREAQERAPSSSPSSPQRSQSLPSSPQPLQSPQPTIAQPPVPVAGPGSRERHASEARAKTAAVAVPVSAEPYHDDLLRYVNRHDHKPGARREHSGGLPGPLPPGWVEMMDPRSGRCFFSNSVTKVRSTRKLTPGVSLSAPLLKRRRNGFAPRRQSRRRILR